MSELVNLGPVTAYALAVKNGFVGTEQEWLDYITSNGREIRSLRAAVGTPLTASDSSDMTDESKIYVYTGTTTSSLTNGYWYYYSENTEQWTEGGAYNNYALETDNTLAVNGMAADAEKVGNELDGINTNLNYLTKRNIHLPSDSYEATGSGVTIKRNGVIISMNGIQSSKYFRYVVNDDNLLTTSSAISGSTHDYFLQAGHKYRIKNTKLSGSVNKGATDTFNFYLYGLDTVANFKEGATQTLIYCPSEDTYTSVLVNTVKNDNVVYNNYIFALTFEDITNEVNTPQMYGAKGDGITDDSAAFQAAINNGGYVHVPSSNGEQYLIKNPLRCKSNCKQIYGDGVATGNTVVASKIIFDLSDYTDPVDLEQLRVVPVFINTECQMFHISNLNFKSLTISGSRVGMLLSEQQGVVDYDTELNNVFLTGFYKVVIFKGRGFTVINSTIASCNYIGDFSWGNETNENHPAETGQRAIRFENNRLHSIAKRFFRISSGHAYGLSFIGNIVDNGTGILFLVNNQAWNWNISNNVIQGMTARYKNAIYFRQGMRNCVISGNTFISDTGYWNGRSLNPSTWITSYGNIEQCSITGNVFKNATNEIIYIENLYGSVISGNAFRGAFNITYTEGDTVHDNPVFYEDTYNGDIVITDYDNSEESDDYINFDEEDDDPEDDTDGSSNATIYVFGQCIANSIVGNSSITNNPNVQNVILAPNSDIESNAIGLNIINN